MTKQLPGDDRDIDLGEASFRRVPTKPLGPVGELRRSTAIAAVGTALSAFAGWQLGGIVGTLLPIAPAVWLGIGIAGLYPGSFFGKPD